MQYNIIIIIDIILYFLTITAFHESNICLVSLSPLGLRCTMYLDFSQKK